MVHDLSNRSADYSSYDDKTRIESADNSSYDDKSRIESSAEELEEINTIEKQNTNKTMTEVIRNRNTIYREDIEDLEKYIEEQVVDIIERQKIKEIIESLYDVVDDLGKLDTTEMQRVKKMVEVLYLTYEKTAEELEEINITEKQKFKEFDILEMTDKDVKLVHEEEYDEIININIVDENREPIFETEKVIIENIEIEAAQKCDKKSIRDKDKIDKITKESLQNNKR